MRVIPYPSWSDLIHTLSPVVNQWFPLFLRSNVVEKCLVHASSSERSLLIQELYEEEK